MLHCPSVAYLNFRVLWPSQNQTLRIRSSGLMVDKIWHGTLYFGPGHLTPSGTTAISKLKVHLRLSSSKEKKKTRS